jgi:hypothetical protein
MVPHPLGIIRAGSILAAASNGSASGSQPGDDDPTLIAETYFDEVPEPRRSRGQPPKIRRVKPASARFPRITLSRDA